MTTICTSNHENHAAPESTEAQAELSGGSRDECELSIALAEHQSDIAAGRFVKESVRRHMIRVTS
jgi:hypothetical protein